MLLVILGSGRIVIIIFFFVKKEADFNILGSDRSCCWSFLKSGRSCQ